MTNMKDKICLITGATSGIGKVTAEELARQGATVVILARNKAKAEQLKDEIISNTGNRKVAVLIADLASLKQVHGAAESFNNTYPRLDVLINNAGFIASNTRKVTEDGFEETLQVNFLAMYLLTALLFDKLKASKEARIINVSSAAHAMAKPDFNDLQMTQRYTALRAYSNVKLYVILFTRALAKRLKDYRSISVNALHPGVVSTNFSSGSGGVMGWGFNLMRPFLITPEKGAETTIYLASDPEAVNYTGLYFAKKKPKKPVSRYLTKENEEKIWEAGGQLTGVKFDL
jgi:retinol dehydrogenase 12